MIRTGTCSTGWAHASQQSLRRALADQIADDHKPGGDADPHLQWRRRDGVEPGHLLDQLQCRARRALGIVLVGTRIAEIGQHANPPPRPIALAQQR